MPLQDKLNSTVAKNSSAPVMEGNLSSRNRDDPSNYLESLEMRLRTFWSDYMNSLDRDRFSETTKQLRERYFRLYRQYRHNKKWNSLINNN